MPWLDRQQVSTAVGGCGHRRVQADARGTTATRSLDEGCTRGPGRARLAVERRHNRAHLAAARGAAGGRADHLGGEGHVPAQEETTLEGNPQVEEALWGWKNECGGHGRLPGKKTRGRPKIKVSSVAPPAEKLAQYLHPCLHTFPLSRTTISRASYRVLRPS